MFFWTSSFFDDPVDVGNVISGSSAFSKTSLNICKFLVHVLLKPLCVSQPTGKFWKRWEYQTTLPASWETCIQVKKQQLEPDMEQWTGSKLGKEYMKAVYCHRAYLTYMQSISWEILGWMKHKLQAQGMKIARRNSSNLRYADDTTLMAESKELKSL